MASIVPVLNRLLPDGKLFGNEYLARNPRRNDRTVGSFRINTRSGKWADFATGDRGGDVVSLVAYLEDVSQIESARLLVQMLRLDPAAVLKITKSPK